jgi:DNA-binding winged helix-turn-helix (wHTH) protein
MDEVVLYFSRLRSPRCAERITVTARECKTLEFLTKNAKHVLSRDEPLSKVWG